MNDTNYGPLAPYYDIMIDWEKRLNIEIPFIRNLVPDKNPGNVKVLDIGCGTGKHLKALKDSGFEVYGLEPSPALRTIARRELPGAVIQAGGFDSLPEFNTAHGPWDLIFCIGNTLSHLPQSRLPGFLSDIKNALKNKGVFLFHIIGYDKILKDKPAVFSEKKVKRNGVDFTFIREYEYLDDSIIFTITVKKDDITVSIDRETLYPHTAESVIAAFESIGAGEVMLLEGFSNARHYTSTSSNLVSVFINNK